MNRLLLCLLVSAGTYCHAAVILSIDPVSQSVPLGSPVNFDVNVSGLGSGTSLGTYDMNLGFDPSLLSYSGIVFGDQLDISGLGDIQSVSLGTDTLEVFELSLDSSAELNSLQAPAFTLGTLSFTALVVGTNSPITLSVNALGDALGNSITPTPENGSVSIIGTTAIPEPTAKTLACIGMFLLALAIYGLRPKLACA